MNTPLATIANFLGMDGLIVVGVFCLLMFGGKKIPELARGVRESIAGFRKEIEDEEPKENKKP